MSAKDPLTFWAESQGDSPALITSHHQYSWQQLNQQVTNTSNLMVQQGLKPFDVLACIGKNDVELLIVYLAAIRLGVIPAMVAPQPTVPLQQKFQQLACHFIWLGKGAEHLDKTSFECSDYHFVSDVLPRISSKACGAEIDLDMSVVNDLEIMKDDAIVSIIFTSGSTGQPKAIAHSASNHLSSATGLLEVFSFTSTDTWQLSLPLFHVSGLAIVWRWLAVGASLKVGDGVSLYDDLNGATHASLVATQLQRLLDSNQPLTLTHVLLGGSAIPLPLALQAKERGIETWLGYGMTEAASTVTVKVVDGQSGVGKVLSHRQLKLVNQRIYIAGETLAKGQFVKGKLQAFDNDGWFDSGDLGEWRQGELHILGRADNQFISGGENIHCEEIEQVLIQHQDIDLVFVVAVKDSEFGARPVALISSHQPLQPSCYQGLLQQQLEKFKWPIDYYLLPRDLLQTNGIKVSRQRVAKWFVENQSTYQLVM